MPYAMDNMPEMMKGAPKHAMEIFIAAFNTAYEKSKDDGSAMAIAMSAVHQAGYKKDDQGNWMTMGNHAEWIPVFKTGEHTDSAGNTRTWTEQDLKSIVSKYNPAQHEAPVVIGHPEHNSPAWAWVDALKLEGQVLYAKLKDIVPEFADMVRKGLFKKRSISLYPDLTLRHIGYLGAMPPAVKGLADVAFGDKDKTIIEFNSDGLNRESRSSGLNSLNGLNGFLKGEVRKMKMFDWLKTKATAEGVTLEDVPVNFSAQNPPPVPPPAGDIKSLVDAEVAKLVKVKEAEFAETQKTEAGKLKAREDELQKKEAAIKKAEITSFCEGLQKEGKITPAMMKHGIGVAGFLESIADIKTPVEFSDGNTKKTQTPFEFMTSFLSAFKKQIEFSEIAGNEKDVKGGNAGEKISALIKQKMDGNKSMSYTQAFNEVQCENIALASEYAQELTA